MDSFKEEKRVVNVQANQEINTIENPLEKKLDGFQSEMDKKIDNLHYSISRLSNQQHVHQEEENPEGECMSDTMVEQCQQRPHQGLIADFIELSAEICVMLFFQEILPFITEEGSGK